MVDPVNPKRREVLKCHSLKLAKSKGVLPSFNIRRTWCGMRTVGEDGLVGDGVRGDVTNIVPLGVKIS